MRVEAGFKIRRYDGMIELRKITNHTTPLRETIGNHTELVWFGRLSYHLNLSPGRRQAAIPG
jgi:hypothetical protein